MLVSFIKNLIPRIMYFLLIAGLVSFGSRTLLQGKTPRAERIATLVTQLGSENFEVREAATKTLASLGESARDTLEKTVGVSKDPELVRRAKELIEKLDKDLYREIYCLKGHSWIVLCVAISPDGNYALSGGQDKTLRLWDLQTGKEVRVFSGHTSYVNGVAF